MFVQFPKDLQNIIDGFTHDLELVNLYEEFFNKYGNQFNITKNDKPLDMSAITMNLQKVWPEKLSDVEDNEGIECSMDYIDDKINPYYYQYRDDEQYTKIYTRSPSQYALHDDLLLFYSMFCFTNNADGVEFYSPCNTTAANGIFYATLDEDYNAHFNTDIYYKDYVDLCLDHCSVDNGHGAIYTNINPDSKEFGWIFSYSSSDDGFSSKICESFSDLIRLLLKKEKICDSLCDCINEFCCEC